MLFILCIVAFKKPICEWTLRRAKNFGDTRCLHHRDSLYWRWHCKTARLWPENSPHGCLGGKGFLVSVKHLGSNCRGLLDVWTNRLPTKDPILPESPRSEMRKGFWRLPRMPVLPRIRHVKARQCFGWEQLSPQLPFCDLEQLIW